MKIEIPENLKADVPHSNWGKVLTATPVIMTVIATLLAGLASSEMTRAQYDRSLAAELQSKAGDQWSFFQAKRLRSGLQQNTLDVIRNTAEIHPLDVAGLIQAHSELGTAEGRESLSLLQKGELPSLPASVAVDDHVKAAVQAVSESRPEAEVTHLLASVSSATLEECLRESARQIQLLDAATKPINREIDRMEKLLSSGTGAEGAAQRRDFTAARLRYTTLRYDAEARLNQAVASIYELQVRKSNLSAERHHLRSQRFFFGMLAAQAGVIIATFAIAAKKRNLLWGIAAGAGVIAVVGKVYIFFFL